jgi:hypothetical protein
MASGALRACRTCSLLEVKVCDARLGVLCMHQMLYLKTEALSAHLGINPQNDDLSASYSLMIQWMFYVPAMV